MNLSDKLSVFDVWNYSESILCYLETLVQEKGAKLTWCSVLLGGESDGRKQRMTGKPFQRRAVCILPGFS